MISSAYFAFEKSLKQFWKNHTYGWNRVRLQSPSSPPPPLPPPPLKWWWRKVSSVIKLLRLLLLIIHRIYKYNTAFITNDFATPANKHVTSVVVQNVWPKRVSCISLAITHNKIWIFFRLHNRVLSIQQLNIADRLLACYYIAINESLKFKRFQLRSLNKKEKNSWKSSSGWTPHTENVAFH